MKLLHCLSETFPSFLPSSPTNPPYFQLLPVSYFLFSCHCLPFVSPFPLLIPFQVSRERVLQEVEQMLRIKSSDRAICLLHYIQLIPLILPVPPLNDLCLASSVDSSASNSNSSRSKDVSESETGDRKKKKKNNNDVEITSALTSEECSFIARSVKDFHPYGCSAALIHLLLQNACAKSVSVSTLKDTDSSAEEGGHGTTCLNSLSKTIINKTPFLFHFCNDLVESQSEETGKILR